MTDRIDPNVDKFEFRDLHPNISLGTASDRYEGWIGQIYSEERYRDKISSRSTTVGGRSFREKVLPVESVSEYFKHFSFLEVDYTFYRLLLDDGLKPTSNYHVLRRYKKYSDVVPSLPPRNHKEAIIHLSIRPPRPFKKRLFQMVWKNKTVK